MRFFWFKNSTFAGHKLWNKSWMEFTKLSSSHVRWISIAIRTINFRANCLDYSLAFTRGSHWNLSFWDFTWNMWQKTRCVSLRNVTNCKIFPPLKESIYQISIVDNVVVVHFRTKSCLFLCWKIYYRIKWKWVILFDVTIYNRNCGSWVR